MKTTSRNLIAAVLLAVSGSLIAGGEARAIKCYLERKELGPADMDAMADKYREKVAAAEENSVCPPGGERREANDLYGRKLRAEAAADSSLLADLLQSMATEEGGEEGAGGQGQGCKVPCPCPSEDTSVKMHKKPDNIGDEFDITKIMKLVEERKNCTSARKPQKTCCEKQPGPWLQHSVGGGQEAAEAQSRNKADRPPTSSLTANVTESPLTGLVSTTGAPYYQPNFNKNFSSVAKETLYRDEGLKSLLDAFIPLLRGKNFTALHKLEENLLQELQGSTQSSEASEKRLTERLNYSLPLAANRIPNATRLAGAKAAGSAVTARASASQPNSQAVEEAADLEEREIRAGAEHSALGRRSDKWEALGGESTHEHEGAKKCEAEAGAAKNGHLWKKQAKGPTTSSTTKGCGEGDKTSEIRRHNRDDDRALENLLTRLRAVSAATAPL